MSKDSAKKFEIEQSSAAGFHRFQAAQKGYGTHPQ